MKKSRKRAKPARQRQATPAPAAPTATSPNLSRRAALIRLRNYGLGAAIIGAGGWYMATGYAEAALEEDLSRIGSGVPTVVQIHDPQCPTCRALQKEARAAMEAFGEGELQYLVANIRQSEGQAFAARHGVGKITLLVFDRRGRRQLVLRGPNTREGLEAIFSDYAERPSKPKSSKPASGPAESERGAPTS